MEWIYINDIETFVMKSVQLYQDERLWLQAKWYRNNQSHTYEYYLKMIFKGRLNGCRIICNSIVHLIYGVIAAASYYEKH
jgi:hypothetical protein